MRGGRRMLAVCGHLEPCSSSGASAWTFPGEDQRPGLSSQVGWVREEEGMEVS